MLCAKTSLERAVTADYSKFDEVVFEESDGKGDEDSFEEEERALKKVYISIKMKDRHNNTYTFNSLEDINITKEDITEIDCSFCNLVDLSFLDEEYINVVNFCCACNRFLGSLCGIQHLKNLRYLICCESGLESLKGCEELEHLEYINFAENEIRTLKPILGLRNLKIIIMDNNRITCLPLQLIRMEPLDIFSYSRKDVKYTPEPVYRWLKKENFEFIKDRLDDKIEKYVYYIFTSTYDMDDVNLLKTVDIDEILREETKILISNMIMDDSIHPYFHIRTRDLFVKIWRKVLHDNNNDVRRKLDMNITSDNFDTIQKQFYTLIISCYTIKN